MGIEAAPAEIVLVSGLPRSGTSMAMRMLAAGGLEAYTDGRREADSDNPQGYYEFEAVKQLKKDNSWVAAARGKALKVISHLLTYLPAGINYRVLFMRRSLDEVLASQAAMLQRSGKKAPSAADDAEMKALFARHLLEIEQWLDGQDNFVFLDVPHGGVIEDPGAWAERISHFLGGKLDAPPMAAAVDPRLYRQRQV